MKKRGQFYLIAGIIIIGLIVGFGTIANYSRKTNPKMLYDLKEELEIESEKVLDYAVRQKLSDNDKKNLLVNFTKLYKNNEEKQNLYFIFGNPSKTNKITFIRYQELTQTQENVYVNNQSVTVDGNAYDISNPGDKVTVKIISDDNEYVYEFELKAGENFYFIISQEIRGDRYIIRN